MAKASYQNGSDCEGRKLGERSGLDIKNLVQKNNFIDRKLHYKMKLTISRTT